MVSKTRTEIVRKGKKLWTVVPLAIEEQFNLMEGDGITWVIESVDPPVAKLWFSRLRKLPEASADLIVADESFEAVGPKGRQRADGD